MLIRDTREPAKAIYDLFMFQYKPLEKKMIKMLGEQKQELIIKKYLEAGYIKKIEILDKYASFLGL